MTFRNYLLEDEQKKYDYITKTARCLNPIDPNKEEMELQRITGVVIQDPKKLYGKESVELKEEITREQRKEYCNESLRLSGEFKKQHPNFKPNFEPTEDRVKKVLETL